MELVGRRSETARLDDALQRSAAGRRTLVTITGDAGIGKSSLLSYVHQRATAAGAAVLGVALTDIESTIGWAGLAALLHTVEPAVASRSATHRAALESAMGRGEGDTVDPLIVAVALADLLRDAARNRPVVVIIDDLHWLDAASAGAFALAVRLLQDVSVLFVMAARPVAIPLQPTRLVDDHDLIAIAPEGLTTAGVRDVLLQRFGTDLRRVELVRLHGITAGNPLHVIETGRLLHAGTPLADALVPASLSDLIDASLASVPADHLPVLQTAALMPTPDMTRLHRVHTPDVVDAAIGHSERLQIVRVVGDAIEFRHPLVRAGLAQQLSTVERRALHRRLADLDDALAVRAFHVSEAATGVDTVAAALLEEAATDAMRRGLPGQAARHAQRSYELSDPADRPTLVRRLWLAADGALDSGDPQAAIDVLTPLVDDPDIDRDNLLATMVVAVGARHGATAALPWIRGRIDHAEPGSPQHARALLQHTRALLFSDIPEAAAVAAEALVIAESLEDEELIDRSLASLAVANTLAGYDVDLDALQRSAARRMAGPMGAVSMASEVFVWADRLDEARGVSRRQLEALSSHGVLVHALDAMGEMIDVHLRSGELALANDLATVVIAEATAAGNENVVPTTLAELCLVRAHLGLPIAEMIADVERLGTSLTSIERVQVDARVGSALFVAGRLDEALTRLTAAQVGADAVGLADLGALPFWGDLVEALTASGAVEAATRTADAMELAASRNGRPRGRAEVARGRALIAASERDLAAAAAFVQQAIDAFDELPLPLDQSRVRLLAGVIARRSKQRSRARQLLTDAHQLATSCGAVALAERITAEIDRLGGGSSNELTATEAQIAALVAAGRSNDDIAAELFISRRTVESNLTRVYRKLGVRSRTELAAALRS